LFTDISRQTRKKERDSKKEGEGGRVIARERERER